MLYGIKNEGNTWNMDVIIVMHLILFLIYVSSAHTMDILTIVNEILWYAWTVYISQ